MSPMTGQLLLAGLTLIALLISHLLMRRATRLIEEELQARRDATRHLYDALELLNPRHATDHPVITKVPHAHH